MSAQIVNVVIKGISPLLMHAYPMLKIEALEKRSAEEQAEHAAYRDPEGYLYIPGINIQRALIAAASFSKGKGRATLQKQVAACVQIRPERCSLGVKDYLIDSRWAVIPSTGARILRHRPRLEEWKVGFEIEYDDVLLKESELRKIVDDAGSRVGILDFRPERKGPFGRFIVVDWN